MVITERQHTLFCFERGYFVEVEAVAVVALACINHPYPNSKIGKATSCGNNALMVEEGIQQRIIQ